MKCHNIVVYIIIPLALFSIMSLFDNVQAQTNSTHLPIKRHLNNNNSKIKTQLKLTQHHLPIKRHLNNNNSKIKTQISLRRL